MVRNVSSGATNRVNGNDNSDGRYSNEGSYNHRSYNDHRHGGRRGRQFISYGNGGVATSYYEGQPYRYHQHNFPQLQKGHTARASRSKVEKADEDVEGGKPEEVKRDTEACSPSSEPTIDLNGAAATPVTPATATTPPTHPMQIPNLVTQLNLIWQGFPPNYEMDPDQLFILSGPHPGDDGHGPGVFEAYRVPKGITVLATPALAPPLWPNGSDITIRLQENSPVNGGFNPNAAPFYPNKAAASDDTDKSSDGCGEGADDVDDAMKGECPQEAEPQKTAPPHPKYPRPPSVTVFNAFFPQGKELPLRQPHPPVYFHIPENRSRCTCQADPNRLSREENSTSPSQASNPEV